MCRYTNLKFCVVFVLCAFLIVGCEARYGNSGGDSNETVNAEEGSVVNAQEIGVGGDVTSSGEGGFATGGAVNVAESSEVDEVSEFQCSDIRIPDGEGGNLWKPEGENSETLVVLFSEDLNLEGSDFEEVPFESVLVRRIEGGGLEELVFRGFENAEFGLRQIWDGSLPGEAYTGELEIAVGNGKTCFLVLDGESGDRVD